MTLRRSLPIALFLLMLSSAGPSWGQDSDLGPIVVGPRAHRIHASTYVFDGHNDLPWALRTRSSTSFKRLDISKPQPDLHTDIPRLHKGNVGAQFWSVYVPANTANDGTALLKTLEQIELVHAMAERYPETFALCGTTADILRARRENKIASLIGVEGGHAIEGSMANLRRLYQLGARYMTLTHSATLPWADSATDEAKHQGLTKFGEAVVHEMNRLGMLVDLSHVSADTMLDTLQISRAPVIFSHSSAFAVAGHPRNVPDNVLEQVRINGGVVMVNFYSGFIHPESARRRAKMFDVMREMRLKYPEAADYRKAMTRWRAENPIAPGHARDVVDHIDHIVKVAGFRHVGIGSDFDGISVVPVQLEDVASYPVITQEMLTRGYSRRAIQAIMSGNVMRVLTEAERVAEEPQSMQAVFK
jgi:membrane dipeptidase